jgi:hypothetical protein
MSSICSASNLIDIYKPSYPGSQKVNIWQAFLRLIKHRDRLCGPVEFLATDPEIRFRFSALPDFLRSSGSGTGSTQPREYN